MAARTTEAVRQEIETEREKLGDAVHVLHRRADNVRRKLPLVAAGIAVVGVAAGLARRRVSRGHAPVTKGHARFPFRSRD